MSTKKKSYTCPECQKKIKQKIKEDKKIQRLNHKLKEKTDYNSRIKRDKKGNIKDFDFDVDFTHSQSFSFDFD